MSGLTLATLRSVAAAVGIELPFQPRSTHAAAVERQVDWRHAALVEAAVSRLAQLGWQPGVEYSFSHFGDRGSVDVLAWQPSARALLVVEVKSDLRDVQATLHALDVKRRVVPRLVAQERGWVTDKIGLVMILADLEAERGRIRRHAAIFDAALPARTVEVRRWLERPNGPLAGLWFLQIPQPAGVTRRRVGQLRVRLGRADSDVAGGLDVKVVASGPERRQGG